MNVFKNKGMFRKLFSSHLIILLISFVVFAVLLNSLIHNEMTARYSRTFDHQKDRLIEHFLNAKEQGWNEETLQTSLEMSMNQENRQILLFNQEGTPVYNTGFLEGIGFSREDLKHVLAEGSVNKRIQGKGTQVVYMIAEPLIIPTADVDEYVMVMLFHEFDNESSQIVWISFLTAGFTILITALMIFFVSRKITAPLTNMRNVAMQYAKGDFSARIHVESKDEIGQLAHTFNYMAKELGSLDQLRKEFVANVSHDLRSPLTSIRGFLGAMMDGTIPKEKHQHYLTIMRHETDRLMKLVNDLLDQTSLEAGNWKLDCKRYNLTEQLRTMLAKMEPTASKHGIDMALNTEEDIYIYADEDRMAQVWGNLLQNALQNSDSGTAIQLEVNKHSNNVDVNVCDEGVGMTEEELSHVWERFYKTDKARSKKTGTGIGLSIVKQIVDLHGASISVKSKKGHGTTFKVTLPK
jgi:signal transduction histidine kinase